MKFFVMRLSVNLLVISVLVLGLISSPISFAQTSDDGEDVSIDLEESLSISTEGADETETDETETDETETDET